MEPFRSLQDAVKAHYERHVYPQFPLWASVRTCDAYALNLDALWARFNGERLPQKERKILLAGCGSFSPYPAAVANPEAQITALDLSEANLRRATLHSWIHGYFNVNFIRGDITQTAGSDFLKDQRFHFIDCYGVLHHIPDVITALNALHSWLNPAGFMRIMVYSQSARRSAQSIRTAMRMLGVHTLRELKQLCRNAPTGSRFRDYLDATPEADFDSGLADLFLHPYAKTYTLEALLKILEITGFEPLQFIHWGALPEITSEIARLKKLEKSNELRSNFILLVGRKQDTKIRIEWQKIKNRQDTVITLNPVIQRSLPWLPFIPLKPEPKLGFVNPSINDQDKRLLSRFRTPVRQTAIKPADRDRVEQYLQALFLIETSRPNLSP
jgi:2-polyprenyl-3-methyl-5-hydroxy-6-metoxy-1,4-benzoquinol methylase